MKELKYKLDSPLTEEQYRWVVNGEFLTATPEEQKSKPIGVYNRTTGQLAENIEILEDNILSLQSTVNSLDLIFGDAQEIIEMQNQVAINTNEINNIDNGIFKKITDIKYELDLNTNAINESTNGILKQLEDIKSPMFTKDFVKYITLDAYNVNTSTITMNDYIVTNAIVVDTGLLLEKGKYKVDVQVKSDKLYKDSFIYDATEVDLFNFNFSDNIQAEYIKIELWRISL